jgi:hypothetical protein
LEQGHALRREDSQKRFAKIGGEMVWLAAVVALAQGKIQMIPIEKAAWRRLKRKFKE